MTASAEKTAPAPASPADVTLDAVLAVGEELRARIAEGTRARRERYQELAGEMRIVPVYDAIRSVLDDPPRVVHERGTQEMAGVVRRVGAARDALADLQREYTRLVERALDPDECYLWNDEFGMEFAKGSNHRARAAVEYVAVWFPLSWVERSNSAGPLRATVGDRGEYVSQVSDGYPAGAVCVPLEWARLRVGRDDPSGSALHELAHRMQDCVPGVARVERAFFERRTAGSPARNLPGYRSDEHFRDGGFFDGYAGRDPDLDAHPSEGHEVFPVGVEALLGGDLETFERFVRHGDHEYEAFVLGCLATL